MAGEQQTAAVGSDHTATVNFHAFAHGEAMNPEKFVERIFQRVQLAGRREIFARYFDAAGFEVGATSACLYGSVPMKLVVKRKQKPSAFRNNFHSAAGIEHQFTRARIEAATERDVEFQVAHFVRDEKISQLLSASSVGPSATDVAPKRNAHRCAPRFFATG